MLTIPVRVAACPRPDLHQPDHNVFVAPTISLDGGIEAERVMIDIIRNAKPTATDAERSDALTRAWAPVYVRHGAKDWDFCDEQGDPRPFDVEEVLADYSIARLVANKCGELGYGSAVLDPFLNRQAKLSPTGQTPDTTSARRPRTRKSPASQ